MTLRLSNSTFSGNSASPQDRGRTAINTGGKSLQEITNFPIIESPPPDEAKPPPADNNAAPQRVPQVIAGHCVGWRDRDELDDADPEELP